MKMHSLQNRGGGRRYNEFLKSVANSCLVNPSLRILERIMRIWNRTQLFDKIASSSKFTMADAAILTFKIGCHFFTIEPILIKCSRSDENLTQNAFVTLKMQSFRG